MKRILGILLALCLCMVPVLAEEIDLESMTTEELLSMQSALGMEIGKRLGTVGQIYSGRYTAGQDIKAGQYVLHVENVVGGWKLYIQVYTLDSGEKEKVDERYLSEGETYAFSLSEGQGLYLSDVGVAYLELLDKPVWAPQP